MQVFLSYSQQDKDLAEQLARALGDAGLEVWRDENQIKPGVDISYAIQDAMEHVDAVVFLVSRDWSSSPYANLEVAAAVARQIRDETLRIIPILTDKGTRPPSLLAGYAYLDMSKRPPLREELSVLLDALTGPRSAPTSEQVRSAQRAELGGTAIALERAQLVESERVRGRERTLRSLLSLTLVLSLIGSTAIVFVGAETEIVAAVATPLVGILAAVLGFYFRDSRQ